MMKTDLDIPYSYDPAALAEMAAMPVSVSDEFHDNLIRYMADQIDKACQECARRGEGWRVAISMPLLNATPATRYLISFDVQYLEPGAVPPPGRTWSIYGPKQ